MTLYAGTSGWQYRHWRGSFYPEDLPAPSWLGHYADRFPTVEVNNTFYRLPDRSTFESWRKGTPDGFVVTVKASRYLTHNKRLVDSKPAVAKLMEAAAGLGDKLGPILLQLPPNLEMESARLDTTLSDFPESQRVAVEFRHPSWYSDEVRSILERHDAALCYVDRDGNTLGPLWRTASWGYLRLHNGDREWWHYSDEKLEHWAFTLQQTFGETADLFVYFNNDMGGAAPHDCRRFIEIAGSKGMAVAHAGRKAP